MAGSGLTHSGPLRHKGTSCCLPSPETPTQIATTPPVVGWACPSCCEGSLPLRGSLAQCQTLNRPMRLTDNHDTSPSNRYYDVAAILSLLLLLAAFLWKSWLAWAHLDFDFGREMIVPMRVALGDVLYRDVRFAYGPFTPHLHAIGYLLFGPHLNVLYASGILSSALATIGAFAVARQLTSTTVAWAAAALILVDLMFFPGRPGRFSYVFPYAFAAVHGLVFVLFALTGALHTLANRRVWSCTLAGICVGFSLLTKQEAGAVGLGIAVLTSIGMLLLDGWASARRRVLILWLSSFAVAGTGYGLLSMSVEPSQIWNRGLFDPMYFGWPISQRILGFSPTAGPAEMLAVLVQKTLGGMKFLGGSALLIALVAWALGLRRRGSGTSPPRRSKVLGFSLAVVLGAILAWAAITWAGGVPRLEALLRLRYSAFPAALVVWLLFETASIARALLARRPPAIGNLQRFLTVSVGLVSLARAPAALTPGQYANFALPVALILVVCLLGDFLPRLVARVSGSLRGGRVAAMTLIVALIVSLGIAHWQPWAWRMKPLTTARGELRLSPFDRYSPLYREALDYILEETDPSDSIAAIPGETSLYFLSGRSNRAFETGLLARIKTADDERSYIEDLEHDPPKLVFLSNRPQPEYGRDAIGIDHGHVIHDWLEDNYSYVETVGNRALRAEVWRRGSGDELAPPCAERESHVVYREWTDRSLRLDIYRPEGSLRNLPTLLFFHGGGWKSGSRSHAFPDPHRLPESSSGERRWPSMLPYLQAGLAVVSAEYRLTSDALAPAAVEDARAAVEWIREHGPEHGLDPNRVVVMGPSAGGHLALMAGLTPTDPGSVAGIIDLYGPTDVASLLARHKRDWALGWIGPRPGKGALARKVSPINHVNEDAPSVLIVHSEADGVVPYEQSVQLADALRESGADVELLTFPDAVHGFFTEQEQRVLEAAVFGFLERIGLLSEADRQRNLANCMR